MACATKKISTKEGSKNKKGEKEESLKTIKKTAKDLTLTRKNGIPIRQLKKYYPILDKLTKSKSDKTSLKILDKLPKAGIDSICECLYNILYSNRLNKKSLHYLKRLPDEMKNIIRYLALTPITKETKTKKKLLRQAGGSIGAILSTILPMLAPLLFGYV